MEKKEKEIIENNEITQNDIPMSILVAQAKKDYVAAINNINHQYNLPAWLAEMILKELYYEIKQLSQEELNTAIIAYQTPQSGEVKENNIDENK